MYDVLVVGAGPVGNYLAYLLSENHDVLVVERKGSFGGKACTGIIGAESYRRLKLPAKAVLNQLNGARFLSRDSGFEVWRDEAQAYVVDRKTLEKELAMRAVRRGADYMMMTRFVGFRGGKAVLQHLNEEFEVEARYYVGADGLASSVAKAIKASAEAEILKGYELDVVGDFDRRKVEVWVNKEINDEFFMWVTPVNDGLARVGTFGKLDSFRRFLRIRGLSPLRAVEVKAGSVALGWRRPWVRGNVALIGDAALQIKPTTAGGIVYGMICAHALKMAIDSDDLKAYWSACRAVRKQISLGLRIRRAFRKANQEEIEKLFRVLSSEDVIKTIEEQADFDDHVKTFKALIRKPSVLAKLIKVSPSIVRALL